MNISSLINPAVHLATHANYPRIAGNGKTHRVIGRQLYRHTRKKRESVRPRIAEALFVMIGADAGTDWLPAQLLREGGYIRTGRDVSGQLITPRFHWN